MFGLCVLCSGPLVLLYNTITLKGFYLDRCFFCQSYSEYSETIVLSWALLKSCEDMASSSFRHPSDLKSCFIATLEVRVLL